MATDMDSTPPRHPWAPESSWQGQDYSAEVHHFGQAPIINGSPLTDGASPYPHLSEHSEEVLSQERAPIVDTPQHRVEQSPVIDKDTASPTQADTFSTRDPAQLGSWTWNNDDESAILRPYEYIASQPGKELRTLLLRKFNAYLQVPEESFNTICNVIRMLHTASLIIDDIQDGSCLRRGKPVAHRVYGVAQTINAGNYMYFQALKELYKLSDPAKAIEVYSTELVRLHRGQGMDLWWRDTLTCPTIDEYLEMVCNKTGGLFRLAIKLMQIESRTSIDCVSLVELVGYIFQIVDDYKNLTDLDYTAKKGFCEDLTEGKFSFPVIHSMRVDSKNSQLLNILSQKTTDIEVKEVAINCIKKTQSLEFTKKYVQSLTEYAKAMADGLGGDMTACNGIHTLLDLISIK